MGTKKLLAKVSFFCRNWSIPGSKGFKPTVLFYTIAGTEDLGGETIMRKLNAQCLEVTHKGRVKVERM